MKLTTHKTNIRRVLKIHCTCIIATYQNYLALCMPLEHMCRSYKVHNDICLTVDPVTTSAMNYQRK